MATLEIEGRGFEGKRTKTLLQTVPNRAIIFLHHQDIDAIAATDIVSKGVQAVVNFSPSMTGTYEHNGVQILLNHHIPVFDIIAYYPMDSIIENRVILIMNESLYIKDNMTYRYVGKLKRYTKEQVKLLKDQAKKHFSDEFRRFGENSLTFAAEELTRFLEPMTIPKPFQALQDEEVLIVVRGREYEADLAVLKKMLKKNLSIIAVDGAADGLLRQGMIPSIIFGDMDSVSEQALTCGAELIAHSYANGQSPGLERLKELGLNANTSSMMGTSEDVAIITAYRAGAKRIYLIGSHTSMNEFLEKGRKGMGSTLLVRMEASERIVDLKGIHHVLAEKQSLFALPASFYY